MLDGDCDTSVSVAELRLGLSLAADSSVFAQLDPDNDGVSIYQCKWTVLLRVLGVQVVSLDEWCHFWGNTANMHGNEITLFQLNFIKKKVAELQAKTLPKKPKRKFFKTREFPSNLHDLALKVFRMVDEGL